MKRKLSVSLLFLMFGLLGCGPEYPLDIPEQKWMTMNRQEQLRAREKQAELEINREKRRAAEAEARKAEAVKWLRDKEANLEQARYGERIQCVLTSAEAYIWGEWRKIEPVALDIAKGMVVEFELREVTGGGVSFQEKAYAGFDGQTLSLCPEKDRVRRNDPSCARVLGTFEQYAGGMKRKIGARDFLRGRIRCDLAPGKGMPERIIINR